MSEQIEVLYVGYDEPWLSMPILGQLRQNTDMAAVYVSGDNFPFAKQLLLAPAQPFRAVVLHMLAGCHELGHHRETDENQSTGLRRAEILREQGLNIPIVLISNSVGLLPKVVHDYDRRVKKAHVVFVGYDNGFQDIVDVVRRVVG